MPRNLMRFRLKAGKHIQEDMSQPPIVDVVEETGEERPRTVFDPSTRKRRPKYPAKVYNKGELIESHIDLVERFGASKFEYVDVPGRYSAPDYPPEKDVAVAPGGQVSSGHQGTNAGIPGPADPPQTVKTAETAEPVPPGLDRISNVNPSLEEKYDCDFEDMTVDDMREVAEMEKVDLKGATRKEEIIAKLRAHKG